MARKFKQGYFRPINEEKYIGDVNNIFCRSSWEKQYFRWCDTNPMVLFYNSEEIKIPYICSTDNKSHTYYPDSLIKIKTKSGEIKTYLVEIKPHKETIPPRKNSKNMQAYATAFMTYEKNKSKWVAATEWCRLRGIEFIILTEYDLGIKQRPKK